MKKKITLLSQNNHNCHHVKKYLIIAKRPYTFVLKSVFSSNKKISYLSLRSGLKPYTLTLILKTLIANNANSYNFIDIFNKVIYSYNYLIKF